LEQVVEIGPMSGKSNVIYWLEKRGIEANEDRVSRIYDWAKQASGVLADDEIMRLV
jgi:2-isopropylmalate synthase